MGDPVAQAVYTVAGGPDPSAGPSREDHRANGPVATGAEALASAAGLRSLICDGWEKVKAGITTTEEVLRVTQQ